MEHGDGVLGPAEVSRLFDVANAEAEAISALEGCVRTLQEAQRAKTALAGLPASDIRAGLAYRARTAGARP